MKIDVINNGYIELVEHWGSDERIIEAARMSTDKGFQAWGPLTCPQCNGCSAQGSAACSKCKSKGTVPGDEKLLRYLYEHRHMTPFEMAGVKIEVQAPIFVFREWHRHRTQSYNELSGRYTELPDLFYTPSFERMRQSAQDNINKQGSADNFPTEAATSWLQEIEDHYETSRELYKSMLASGVAREVARIIIPVGQVSRMQAQSNLRNWMGFLTLRTDKAAQWEIRQYANALKTMLEGIFPRSMELFNEPDPRDLIIAEKDKALDELRTKLREMSECR